MSHLAISLNDEPSLIFCIMAARSMRARSLMREQVARAYFCRGGTTLGDEYFAGVESEEKGAISTRGEMNLAGEGAASNPGGDANAR